MAFSIGNHRLLGVPFQASPNIGGALSKTSLLVIHDTASQNAEGAISWLCNKAAKASAHLVIDEKGHVTQLVPFNKVAWHAGASEWRGRSGCNSFSIGIELSNPGPLKQLANGSFVDAYGEPVPVDEVEYAAHHNAPNVTRPWKLYSQKQIDTVAEVARAICTAYGIHEIAGHDEIAPKRKCDPGPAFDMERFRTLVLGRQ